MKSIRKTAFQLFAFYTMLMLFTFSGTLFILLQNSFLRLEENYLEEKVTQAHGALDDEVHKIAILAQDWAVWDATYDFIREPYEAYIRENLAAGIMENQNIDFILYLNRERQAVFLNTSDTLSATDGQSIAARIRNDHDTLCDITFRKDSNTGLYRHGNRLMLIAAWVIYGNERQEPPGGHLVIGRLFGAAEKNYINQKTGLAMNYFLPEDFFRSHSAASRRKSIGSNLTYRVERSRSSIYGYTPYPLYSGLPGLFIEIVQDRDIYYLGIRTFLIIMAGLFFLTLLFSLGVLHLLDRRILLKLLSLNSQVGAIADNLEFQPVTVTGSDELGQLGVSINTMLKQIEEAHTALESSETVNRTLAIALRQSDVPTIVLDNRLETIYANKAFRDLTGVGDDELRQNTLEKLGIDAADEKTEAVLNRLKSGQPWSGDFCLERPGFQRWLHCAFSIIKNEKGTLQHYLGIVRDITEQRSREAAITFQAHHDPLTGLSNRAYFLQVLEKALAEAGSDYIALLYADLDGFKPINDTYGHDEGDKILKAVAQRFAQAFRQQDTIARIGGDEFCFLLPQYVLSKGAAPDYQELRDTVRTLAERLLEVINRPFLIGENRHTLGISIGISIYPRDTGMKTELMRMADKAMYSAKQSGKNRYCFYDEMINEP